jgi:hypothetical protein
MFGRLALEKEKSVEIKKRVFLSQNQDLKIYATSSLEKIMNIGKNLFFPLYCEVLYIFVF